MTGVHGVRTVVCALSLALVAAPSPAAAQPSEWGREAVTSAAGPVNEAAPKAKGKQESKKRVTRPRPRPSTLGRAKQEREEVAAHAADLAAEKGSRASAEWLDEQAERTQDPLVSLMAARSWLEVPATDATLERATLAAKHAVALAVDPPVPRIAPKDAARVQAESEEVLRTVEQRRAARQAARRAAQRKETRGKQELIAGGVLAAVGLTGVGLIVGGATVHRKYHDFVDPLRGSEHLYDLGQLKANYDAGTTMIGAGAVLAAVGLGIGVPLIAVGTRELRAGRRERLMLAVKPAWGGMTLVGRF